MLNEQATFLSNQYNWYLTDGGKVDKTYDALKALMSDDYFGGARSAKYNWLTGSEAWRRRKRHSRG